MFSGTNLLTSCHSASCLFSAVFCSRKASKEIFSELDGTKDKLNNFPWGTRSPEVAEEAGQGAQTALGAARPSLHDQVVWLGPSPSLSRILAPRVPR